MNSTKVTPSDSRFYPADCKCLKQQTKSNVLIECSNCIENISNHGANYCSCSYRTITQSICHTCAYSRDKLDNMHIEFDILVQNLRISGKSYTDCSDIIYDINDLLKKMRYCNRVLTSRLSFDTQECVNTKTSCNSSTHTEIPTSDSDNDDESVGSIAFQY